MFGMKKANTAHTRDDAKTKSGRNRFLYKFREFDGNRKTMENVDNPFLELGVKMPMPSDMMSNIVITSYFTSNH